MKKRVKVLILTVLCALLSLPGDVYADYTDSDAYRLMVSETYRLAQYAADDSDAMTLDEALKLVDSGEEIPDRILLTEDFSMYYPLSENEYTPANGGVVLLRRDAPLKAFETRDTPYSDDSDTVDLGETCVYLCAKEMRDVPVAARAHSMAEVKNLFVVETMYTLSGQISSSVNGSSGLPSLEYLLSIINGTALPESEEYEDQEKEEEEIRYNYRPVFDGFALATLYDITGGSAIIDGEMSSYSEMRNNPEADDLRQIIELLNDLQYRCLNGDPSFAYGIENSMVLTEDIIQELQNLTINPKGFAAVCEEKIWEAAEKLKALDPDAEEFYDAVITKHSIDGLLFLADIRGYDSVTASDKEITDSLLYIGVPDEERLQNYLTECTELLNQIGWNMTAVF